MKKPLCTYIPRDSQHIKVGERAAIWGCYDHPIIKPSDTFQGFVHTSTVQSYKPSTGEFETLNTRYKPKTSPS